MKEIKYKNEETKPSPVKSKNITAFIITALVIGVISFFCGTKYQDYKISKMRNSFAGQFRQGANLPGGPNRNIGNQVRLNGGRPVMGEIVSQDDKSITVKMQDGSSKIVILSNTTTYSKSESGTKTDLKTGIQVGVFGTENSDGSVTAQNIQLNPEFRMFGNGTSPSPSN